MAALEAAVGVRGALIMGVCNLTPDSFSDGGLAYADEPHEAAARARAHVDRLHAAGADVIDLGGESTRPGALPVDDDEQLRRLLPALEHALARDLLVSIDTQSPFVAEVCLARGAHVLNDVSCLRDERLAQVVARFDAAYVLMHARGTQAQMAGFGAYPEGAYGDVVDDVVAEWSLAADRAVRAGVARDALVFDPGLGFAKTARHSAELLARTEELVQRVACPVLVGASRKSFLALVDDTAPPSGRVGASVAAAVFAVRSGARWLRVHDVRETKQALDLETALSARRRSASSGSRAAGSHEARAGGSS